MVKWRWRDGPVSIRGSFYILALQAVNRLKLDIEAIIRWLATS